MGIEINPLLPGCERSIEMKKAYPVFIKQSGKDYLVYVPDMDLYTEGQDLPDAIAMARDAIGLKGMDLEDDKQILPEPSTKEAAVMKAAEDADEDFDYSDGLLTYVDVDFIAYRNRMKNRAVKKNCTIPYWLNEKAEEQGVNFSKVLQEALLQQVGNK